MSKRNEAAAFSASLMRSDLLRAVSSASRAIERRNTIPILSFVQLAMGFGTMAVTGTNLDVEVRVEIEARGEGAVCLPAHRLRDMLRAMPGDTIEMLSDPSGVVTLTAGDTVVTYGSLPAVDHPPLSVDTELWSLTLADGVFAYLVGGAATAMSADECRYYLNGVCLEVIGGQAVATATDGHRLVSRASGLSGDASDRDPIIVPREAVPIALSQIGGGEARITAFGLDKAGKPTKLEILGGGVRLRAKLIDGTFPDWRRVVPTADVAPVLVNIGDLQRALRMARANGSERGRAVKLEPHRGAVRVSSSNPDVGTLATHLCCSDLPAFNPIGMDARYLGDMADAAARIGSKTLRLHITKPDEPIRILPDASIVGATAVLMPMRV